MEKDSIAWKITSIIITPICAGLLGLWGTFYAGKIEEKVNKASLMATFKTEIIEGQGPGYFLARHALHPYFTSQEWKKFIEELIAEKESNLLKTNTPAEQSRTRKAIYSIFENESEQMLNSLPESLRLKLKNNPYLKSSFNDFDKDSKLQNWLKR